MADRPGTFVCPACGQVNRHPNDVANRYCGRCHWWTGDPQLGTHNPSPATAPDPPTPGERQMTEAARVIVEVQAGLIPEQPDAEYTRRYAITSQQWADAADTDSGQAKLLAEINGRAWGYAMLLMLQPNQVNWVRTDWLWL